MMSDEDQEVCLQLISKTLRISDRKVYTGIFLDVVDSLHRGTDSSTKATRARSQFQFYAIRTAVLVHCDFLKNNSLLYKESTADSGWWMDEDWWTEDLELELIGTLYSELSISHPQFCSLLLCEIMRTLPEGRYDEFTLQRAIREALMTIESQLMLGENPCSKDPLIVSLLNMFVPDSSAEELQLLQDELQLRVDMFFTKEGNNYLKLIATSLQEMIVEFTESIRLQRLSTRISITKLLPYISLDYEQLQDTQDPEDDIWLNRVVRSYKGGVVEMDQLMTLCKRKRSWTDSMIKRVSNDSPRRMMKDRLRPVQQVSREQVLQGILLKKDQITWQDALPIIATNPDQQTERNIRQKVNVIIRPQFERWFQMAKAPIRGPAPNRIFCGPKPEHIPLMAKRRMGEIDDEELATALGVPLEKTRTFTRAKRQIMKAFRQEVLAYMDQRRLQLVLRYEASNSEEREQQRVEMGLSSKESLRCTLSQWRKKLRKKGLY